MSLRRPIELAHLGVVALLALQMFAAAVFADEPAPAARSDSVAAPRPLRIGTSADYAPFTFLEGGVLAGIEIEMGRELAAETGRELEWVQLPFEQLLAALRAGTIDVVMSGMSVTPRRSEGARFTQPYLRVGQMALIRAAERSERSRPDDIGAPTSRVGFRPGTTGEQFVRSRLANAQAIPFDSIDAGVMALRDRRIDYFVHDAPTIWRIVGGFESDETELIGLYRPLTEEYLAWAVRLDDEALAQELNAHLAEWKRNGRLEILLDTWIRTRRIVLD